MQKGNYRYKSVRKSSIENHNGLRNQGTNLERWNLKRSTAEKLGCIFGRWTHIHRIITKPTNFNSFFQLLRLIFFRKKKPNIPLISFFRSLRKEIHDHIQKTNFYFSEKTTSFCRFFRLSELIFYQKKILKISKFLIFCLVYIEIFSIFFKLFFVIFYFLYNFCSDLHINMNRTDSHVNLNCADSHVNLNRTDSHINLIFI